MASEPEVVEIPEDEDENTVEGEEDGVLEDDPHDARLCALMSDAIFKGFERHVKELVEARKRRQEALAFKSAVEEEGAAAEEEGGTAQTQDELDGLGVRLPADRWRGDTNMRTLQKLLSRVDARGFERSAQQLEFHQAFMKAAARVIYRGDWETDRPMIMDKYGWTKCNSEVLISTPRRFGKTFRQAVQPRTNRQSDASPPSVDGSIAIFCACLALALGLEIVVFSKQGGLNRLLPGLLHCALAPCRSGPSRLSEAPRAHCRVTSCHQTPS